MQVRKGEIDVYVVKYIYNHFLEWKIYPVIAKIEQIRYIDRYLYFYWYKGIIYLWHSQTEPLSTRVKTMII